MSSKQSIREKELEAEEFGARFKLIDIIFLPFNYVFRILVLFAVLIKCIFGPMQAVYPFVYCDSYINEYPAFFILKILYLYYTRFIYGIDLFLHIMHRQIADEAMKREHVPKSGIKILIDFLSLIPLCEIMSSEAGCPGIQVFPNILALIEFIVVYRIVEFFDIEGSHTYFVIACGYIVIFIVVTNFFAVSLLLFTLTGLCARCGNGIFDWRSYLTHTHTDINYGFNTYFYAVQFCLVYIINYVIDEMKPNTVAGFIIVNCLVLSSYVLFISVIVPKLFAENILRLRRIIQYHRHIQRILLDTKRRNPSDAVLNSVEQFYNVLWKKRHGLTHLPEIILNLPRHMRIDIRQDLVWAVFHHSPTLRNTSTSFKRWICENIRLQYKLPGEVFFTGPNCLTNLYYIKSGIVQFVSSDDNRSALLSVSGGTIFGDVSFYNPPSSRNITVKCFTYCETFVLTRRILLKALHLFPEDRRQILYSAKARIRHARTLYQCKLDVPNLERSEREGLMWIKGRWWEIFTYIENWKKISRKEGQKCEIPEEKSKYHCAKYIGQLVLCSEYQLQKKSIFASTKFPWILMPNSEFLRMWSNMIKITTFVVLVIYPPHITQPPPPLWFDMLEKYVDLVFAMDVFIHLITTTEQLMASFSSLSDVMLMRIKTPQWMLDFFSALWLEEIVSYIGLSEYRDVAHLNRVCKIYLLFIDKNVSWNWKINPITNMFWKLVLSYVCFEYLYAYLIHVITPHLDVTPGSLIGPWPKKEGRWGVIISWLSHTFVAPSRARTKMDLALNMLHKVAGCFLCLYLRSKYMAILYLERLEKNDFQYFVSNLKDHYIFHKIHPDLLKRLDRYLICHWKYFQGMDILQPNILKDEPFDIFYKCHGALAEQIIGTSKVFSGADKSLIKELAYNAKYLILPKASTLTLFGVPSKHVTWIANGEVKYEYHNDKGELVEGFRGSGQMLSMGSVFYGKASLRTLSTATDCEIIYIPIKEFTDIYKRYPLEWGYIEKCKEEFSSKFDKIFYDYIKKHKEYQKKLRKRIFHARQSVVSIKKKPEDEEEISADIKHNTYVAEFTSFSFLEHPETKFIKWWMFFRMLSACVMIVVSTISGGSCANISAYLIEIRSLCHGISVIDITLKCFIPFYDKKGIVITDTRRCFIHYITRGFLLDLVGIMPLNEIAQSVLSKSYTQNFEFILENTCQFAHLYLITGYFNYKADVPALKSIFILIFKSQLVLFLVFLAVSTYFVSTCIKYTWNDRYVLINMEKTDKCWMPFGFKLNKQLSISDMHLIVAHSFVLTQNAFFQIMVGMYRVGRQEYEIILLGCCVGCMFWYVFIYNQTLFMLYSRSNHIFKHGVTQLTEFMKAERVEEDVIEKVVDHYNYVWMRTKGLNIQDLMSERIGMVFKEDLNYYFFKKTFAALDTMINGGESMQRRLANTMVQAHFLPGEDIMREMDLVSKVYLVHRGNVLITQNGKKMATLYKGGLFGQFESAKLRPIKITAQAIDYTDMLVITVKAFQTTLTEKEISNILKCPDAANDYMSLKKVLVENPYNTVKYLLRGTKTIKLPKMSAPIEADKSKWYKFYLIFVWLFITTASVAITLLLLVLPHKLRTEVRILLYLLDIIHLLNIISEFYTMELAVEGHKCVYKYIGWRNLAEFEFYLDAISFLVPVIAEFAGYLGYGIFRVIRLHHYKNFHTHFCSNFKNRTWAVVLKYVIGLLIIHAFTCGWMYLACGNVDDYVFLNKKNFMEPDPDVNKSINYEEWEQPFTRQTGCVRLTRTTNIDGNNVLWFVKGKSWHVDYLLALTLIMLIYMRTNVDVILPLSNAQLLYRVFVANILYVGEMWITSIAIGAIYTKYRELYQYAFDVSNLIQYLKQNGLTKKLLNAVQWYTRMLWRRQKGNWIPEMALQAPMCLREDIFSALYIHHLMTPTLFQNHFPPYFMRQLVVRFKRMVIFPGKFIIREGDIFPNIYFIHEGEVEKWYLDSNGDNRMVSVLTMNGYFGLIPGLFPNTPFMFTYYSRTVCDMLMLRHEEWQDLLDGYPDIKNSLYTAAREILNKELLHRQQ